MATPAPSAVDPAWLKNARELVGLHEIVGSRHEPKVLEFFKEAGHPEIHDDETAWCAAFANAMLRRAGYAGTGALNARSFLNWGTKLTEPKLGCIAVFKRGNSSWQGHVAFFLRDLGNHIEVLGGNQGNAVSIIRMPKAELLGYRWPLISTVAPKPVVVTQTVPAKPKVDKKTVAAGTAAGGVVVGTVTKGAQDGWDASTWLLIAVALVVMAGVGYAIYRWRKPLREMAEAHAASPIDLATAATVMSEIQADKPADPEPLDPLDPLPIEAAEKPQEAPAMTDGSSSTVSVTVRSAPAAAPANRTRKKAKASPKKPKSARKRKAA